MSRGNISKRKREMKEEIKAIIYNPGIGLTDKIVKIDRLISGSEWDVEKLSRCLGVPSSALLSEPDPVLFIGAEKPKSNVKMYIDLFHEIYVKIKYKKYVFTGQDIGQIKNMIKSVDYETFRKCLSYVVLRKQQEKTVKLEFDMERIIKNFTPGQVYKNINYLIAESGKAKTKGWGYGK